MLDSGERIVTDQNDQTYSGQSVRHTARADRKGEERGFLTGSDDIEQMFAF